ncbi:hypothetical protein AURDEDRAFT_124926 [Auricularia subglabra TFB-10046 SS5]|nr:hypothetical protein AURDEDRAFT_124926 [Auricularia subglabra TFB-10046 SS5]
MLRAVPFLWTTSLVLHASPLWLLEEQFLAVSRSLPALKHLRVHVLFRQSEATQASAYRGALSQINTFLTSTAGKMLLSVGFWFSLPGQERPSSGALREMLLTSKPLLIGPKVGKLFFFPRFGATRNHNGADLGEDALRFLPWPCGVKEIAMSATDFCICDPINWHRHYELERVTLLCEDVVSEVYGDESLAQRIAASLGRAAPWWRDSLTLLRLENTVFDTSCALAVAELRSLAQLDLHPSVVDASEAMTLLEVENENLMEAQERLEMDDQGHMLGTRTRRRMVIVPDHADLLGSEDFAQLEEDTAAAMLMLLKLCLPERRSKNAVLILRFYLETRRPLGTPFAFTRRLRLVCNAGDLGSLTRAARACFPRLESLYVLCKPISYGRPSREWVQLATEFTMLGALAEWTSLRHFGMQLELALMEIEDVRPKWQLRRRSSWDAARSLAASMLTALAGWTANLKHLRLLGVSISYGAIVVLGQLHALQSLELAPRSIELGPFERDLLAKTARRVYGRVKPEEEEVSMEGIGLFTGKVVLGGALDELVDALKYLLGNLGGLRTLRVREPESGGDRRERVDETRAGCAADLQGHFLDAFDHLWPHVTGTLSFWGTAAGWRSPECLRLEGVERRGWQRTWELSDEVIGSALSSFEKVTKVGPIL